MYINNATDRCAILDHRQFGEAQKEPE